MKLQMLLKRLADLGGSDLHVIPGLPPAIRVLGELEKQTDLEPVTAEQAEDMVYGIINEEQRKKFERDEETRHELDFAYSIPDVGRFRINLHRQRGSVGMVARRLEVKIPDLNSLGLPPGVQRFVTSKKGLALVTGPTGSGKSTTLAAVVDKINESRPDHIITIEDPIEYLHRSKRAYVMQREVGQDTLTFKNALKHALRQDPDVILIGEMRDFETIGIAITSAETGHLVFGTLHTNSASQTCGRMIDVFPADQHEQIKTQLAANLLGVLAQILLPTKDRKSRCVATEFMISNPAIRNNIRTYNIDAIYQSIQTGSTEGMVTMDQSLSALVRNKKITYGAAAPHFRDANTAKALEGFKAEEDKEREAQERAENQNLDAATRGAARKAAIPPWEQQKS